MEQNIRQSRANTDIVHWQERLLPIVKTLYDQREISFTSVAAKGAPGAGLSHALNILINQGILCDVSRTA